MPDYPRCFSHSLPMTCTVDLKVPRLATSYRKLGRLKLCEKMRGPRMASDATTSWTTLCVAVAVSAMMGTSGKPCLSLPSEA